MGKPKYCPFKGRGELRDQPPPGPQTKYTQPSSLPGINGQPAQP